MDLYAAVSRDIHAVFARYTPQVEPLALDEAFLDVTASERLFGGAAAIARRIKDDIRGELSLVASVGVAGNKFLAKLASALDKPDGLTVVPADAVQAFLDPMPVTRLWGVGDTARARLAGLGIHTVADLRSAPEAALRARFGRHADHLRELARGVDRRAVVPDARAKSLSHETTFPRDVSASPAAACRSSCATATSARSPARGPWTRPARRRTRCGARRRSCWPRSSIASRARCA